MFQVNKLNRRKKEQSPKPAMAAMTALPDSLLASFKWAEKAVEWCRAHGDSQFFDECERLPVSTWFSGYGCMEEALTMLNAALSGPDGRQAFQSAYQVEIMAKASHFVEPRLSETVCQHADIMRFLTQEARETIDKIEKTEQGPAEPIWNYLKSIELEKSALCHRHRLRCKLPLSIVDVSGSMCVHWSSMGTKAKQQGKSHKLMLVWLRHHFSIGTPMLVHETLGCRCVLQEL